MSITAESSPATLSDTVAGLSAADRAHWKLTGDLPGVSESSEPPTADSTPEPDSSPAAPAAQAVETATFTPPASESGTPKKTKNAASRNEELDADIASLRTKLAERRRLKDELDALGIAPARPEGQTHPAASSPAPSAVRPLAEIMSSPDLTSPMLDEDAFFTAYPEAKLRDFGRYVSRYETLTVLAETRQQERVKAAEDAHREQWQKAQAVNPRLLDELPVDLRQANPWDPDPSKPWNTVAREIFDSPHADALLLHFASDPADARRIASLGGQLAIIRDIGRLESRLSASSSVNPNPAPRKREASSAPPPGSTLGSKASGSVDTAEAAIAAGDTGRYMAIMNARDRAMAKGAS